MFSIFDMRANLHLCTYFYYFMKTSFCVCFSRMIHEAHMHTITVGGLRIHALLQSTFEVRAMNSRPYLKGSFINKNTEKCNKRGSQVTFSF